ncbi:fumarylacetoacetate hydrolase family protein [Arthrobacter sp. KBS0702]|uniref:fumarylacetoacetate hydrolase family protein n=1 Tax=Arthrobacter sp. KBS0702 TaxID=2578107 RepID=UPI00110E60A9|nr:fumarylacetoacetate hydrolase family protein [Arthrobacter sp. KBS0702]QDW30629.1 fumarylacetoacetate hydrolase family protein [Arthrobacter sp. KBS0702]
MKLITFRRPDGTIGHGRLVNDSLVEDTGDGDLSSVVASGEDVNAAARATYELAELNLLAPVLAPPKVLCVATNYQEHIVEGGGERVDPARVSPKIFLKPATTIIGDGATYEIPEISTEADWEAELCIVIGKTAKGISEAEALDYVFGYAASNDISLRSLSVGYERDMNPWAGFFDWLEGKWSDGSAPIGPWIVTADEVPDPQDIPVGLSVNGEPKQKGTTADMIHTCAQIIAFASRLCTLQPGDLILTGTPAGVGATTGTFLNDGDVMVADLGPVGRLTTLVRRSTVPD